MQEYVEKPYRYNCVFMWGVQARPKIYFILYDKVNHDWDNEASSQFWQKG